MDVDHSTERGRIVTRSTYCVPLLVLVTAAAGADDVPAGPVAEAVRGLEEAELRWASGVVTDLFDAIRQDESVEVEALLVPEYAKALHERDFVKDTAGSILCERVPDFTTVALEAPTASPDGNEIRIEGRLTGEDVRLRCVIRVTKDDGAKHWRVGYLFVEPVEDEK